MLTCANKLYTYMGIDFFEVLQCCELDKVTNSTFEYQSRGLVRGAGVLFFKFSDWSENF